MSTEARSIIAQWRKELNIYRRTSRDHVKNYINLMQKSNDDQKEAMINIFGEFFFQCICPYFKKFQNNFKTLSTPWLKKTLPIASTSLTTIVQELIIK